MKNNVIDMRSRQRVNPKERDIALNLSAVNALKVIDVHLALNNAMKEAKKAVALVEELRGELLSHH